VQRLDPDYEAIQTAISKAHALKQRGNSAEAEKILEDVLETYPDHPAAIEAKADILIGQGKTEEAKNLLAELVAKHPEFTGAERKYAELVLKAAEKEWIVAQAMSGDLSSFGPGGAKRNAGAAAFLSMMLPGFGQIYVGEMARGIVFAVVSILLWVGLFSLGLGPKLRLEPAFWPLFVGLLAIYIVSMIDAAVAAGRMSPPLRKERPAPPVDKPFE
jgi:tetratricopeptide (TPR) repeat protein